MSFKCFDTPGRFESDQFYTLVAIGKLIFWRFADHKQNIWRRHGAVKIYGRTKGSSFGPFGTNVDSLKDKKRAEIKRVVN